MPRPWRYGSLYLPDGSKNLDNPEFALEPGTKVRGRRGRGGSKLQGAPRQGEHGLEQLHRDDRPSLIKAPWLQLQPAQPWLHTDPHLPLDARRRRCLARRWRCCRHPTH